MKVLITGNKGQLGRECESVFQGSHEIRGADLPELDLTNRSALDACVENFQPDVIVNCAAYTRVDDAEQASERARCRQVNAGVPEMLAEICKERDLHLIHISTDYVFDGKKPVPVPYIETDPTGPLSWYGRTKLEGEDLIRKIAPRYAILRTAWLYGQHGRNFPQAIVRKALACPPQPLKVVHDQYGSPTCAERLAQQVFVAAEAGATGLFHATSEGACTWFDFARELLGHMNISREVIPCRSADYPTPAVRPANSILENRALKEKGLNVFVPWQQDVEHFVRRHGEALRRMVQP